MKKEYIKPEIEIITFTTNDMMSISDPTLPGDGFGEWPDNWN